MPTTARQTEPIYTPSSVSLSWVQNSDLDTVWEEVSPILERAIQYNNGEFFIEDVLDSLRRNEEILWVAVDNSLNNEVIAASTTKIIKTERKRILFIRLMAGKHMESWIHFSDQFERYAHDNNCDSIEANMVPKVAQLVSDKLKDYRVTHHVLVKDLRSL